MKIISIYSIKGGVGKTATAVNLAYLAAQEGAKTLLWDLDPQGAASFYFRIKRKVKGGSKALIERTRDADDLIKGSDFENLDLIPADFSYRNMDLFLEKSKRPTSQFQKIVKPLSKDYDYLFLDCPPSMSLVSENVLQISHVMLVPIIPSTLSLRTLKQLTEFCQSQKLKHVQIIPFFSMVDRRKKLHREVMESLPIEYSQMLTSYTPNSAEVERMGLERNVIVDFSPRTRAAISFKNIWKEVKGAWV